MVIHAGNLHNSISTPALCLSSRSLSPCEVVFVLYPPFSALSFACVVCVKAHGSSAVIYACVQVFVYLLISKAKTLFVLCVLGPPPAVTCAFTSVRFSLFCMYFICIFGHQSTRPCSLVFLSPTDLPPDQTSHWVTMGTNQEDHIFLQSS